MYVKFLYVCVCVCSALRKRWWFDKDLQYDSFKFDNFIPWSNTIEKKRLMIRCEAEKESLHAIISSSNHSNNQDIHNRLK